MVVNSSAEKQWCEPGMQSLTLSLSAGDDQHDDMICGTRLAADVCTGVILSLYTEWAKKVIPTLSNFGDAMKDTSSLPMKSDEMR